MQNSISNRNMSEVSKTYRFSALFIIIGLVMLHWSQAMYFVAGNKLRLGSLGIGFILIVGAACLRARWGILRHSPMVVVSGFYFFMLALLSKFQMHMIWFDKTQQIFCVVCWALFVAGYILAQEKRVESGAPTQWSLVVIAGIAIVALLAFMRFVKGISFHGTSRGFGGTTLNPVGVAYANACLGLVFILLSMFSKSLWRKALFLLTGALALFVVLSSASRGAVIWGSAAIGFFFILNRHRKYLSPKAILFAVLGVAIVIPVLMVIYKTNYGVAERFDVLFDRFEDMFYSLSGEGEDLSLNSRQIMWEYYLSNVDQWILIGEKGYVGYPHNQWIEIGARFGLLGLPMLILSITVLIGLLVSVAKPHRWYPDLEYSIVVTLFIFGYLQSMSSLSLQVNRVLWLGFGYLLGHYMVRRRMPKFR